jgi:hypothetical protein
LGHFSRRRIVYLERLDLLAEIDGVPADMGYIPNPQLTALELDSRDGEVAVIVSHDTELDDKKLNDWNGGRGVYLRIATFWNS